MSQTHGLIHGELKGERTGGGGGAGLVKKLISPAFREFFEAICLFHRLERIFLQYFLIER